MLSLFFSDPLPVGTPAPDWTLRDQDGAEFTLSTFRGKNVVLIFYPRDETPTCRTQLCEFRDAWEEAKQKNTTVFGINIQTADSHAVFRSANHLPFPLLVDENGRVCKAYKSRGIITRRTVYLVDPTGVIRYAQRGKPPVKEVLAAAC